MTEIVDTDNKPLLDWLVASIRSHADRLAAMEARAVLPAPFRAEEFGISQEAPICPDPTGEGSAYQGDPEAGKLPEPWNEESSRRILALVDERDRYRDLATRKTTEAEDNLVRAVLAERELANLKADLTKMIKEDACWCVRRSPPATVSEWAT